MADRTGLSYRKETGIVGSVLQDSLSPDGTPLDIHQFNLSKNEAHRERGKSRSDQEIKLYEIFFYPTSIQLFTGMRNF